MRMSYGIIPVFISESGAKEYLVLQNHKGFWGFPKGHHEGNESPEDTAIRETYEETGITVKKENLQSSIQYEYEQPIKGVMQIKRVVLFPVIVRSKLVKVQQEEIARYEWAPYEKAISLVNLPSVVEPLSRVEEVAIERL